MSALDSLELLARLALLESEFRELKEFHVEVRAAGDSSHAQAEQVMMASDRRSWKL
jgi:hypothetical protein